MRLRWPIATPASRSPNRHSRRSPVLLLTVTILEMETTLIGIGGINLRISLPDPSFQLEKSYSLFRVHSVPTMGDWHIHPEPIPDTIKPLNNLSRTSRIRDISHSNGKIIFRLWWQPDALSPWKAAIMDPFRNRVDIWVNRIEGESISCPLFAIDLLLFSYLLLSRGGLIIHAAAVKIGEEAYLFPAPSGGGKSTWSDLMAGNPEWTVLGEDKVIVRKVNNSYQVFGTPWNPRPEYLGADNAPLRGIYFLSHSKENRILKIGGAEAASRLLQQASLPFQSRQEMEQALIIVEEIAETTPAYQFGFRPDLSAVAYFSSKNKQVRI